jgi:hypothetical protein
MDAEAKHYRHMKSALWLYLYLLLNANRRTGVLLRKIQTVSRDMGVTRDTTVRWLNVLRTNGYIGTINTGRSLTIQVTRWKPLAGVGTLQHQKSESSDSRYGKYPTPVEPRNRPIPLRNSSVAAAANETKIQIVINNDLRRKTTDKPSAGGFTRIGDHARTEVLAHELAKALNDSAGIELYRSYCARYPEWLLRKVLAEVQNVPSDQIVKSRGALFNHLVQHYAKATNDNPRR